MVLTKAAFCHHKFFSEYTDNLPRDIWMHVHKNKYVRLQPHPHTLPPTPLFLRISQSILYPLHMILIMKKYPFLLQHQEL